MRCFQTLNIQSKTCVTPSDEQTNPSEGTQSILSLSPSLSCAAKKEKKKDYFSIILCLPTLFKVVPLSKVQG